MLNEEYKKLIACLYEGCDFTGKLVSGETAKLNWRAAITADLHCRNTEDIVAAMDRLSNRMKRSSTATTFVGVVGLFLTGALAWVAIVEMLRAAPSYP